MEAAPVSQVCAACQARCAACKRPAAQRNHWSRSTPGCMFVLLACKASGRLNHPPPSQRHLHNNLGVPERLSWRNCQRRLAVSKEIDCFVDQPRLEQGCSPCRSFKECTGPFTQESQSIVGDRVVRGAYVQNDYCSWTFLNNPISQQVLMVMPCASFLMHH